MPVHVGHLDCIRMRNYQGVTCLSPVCAHFLMCIMLSSAASEC